jgi:hypothetical protein
VPEEHLLSQATEVLEASQVHFCMEATIVCMAIGDQILLERLSLREQMVMQQADALDVKASILLVAVTFLATHSMWVLSKALLPLILYDQFLSVLLQIIAGVLLAVHLRVSEYTGVTAEAFPGWRDDLVKFYGESREKDVEQELSSAIIKKSIECVSDAVSQNNRKAKAIQFTYWLTLGSFVFNLIGAASLLF